jgi:two-component system, OmpR family, response regulator ChvI
VTLEENGFKIDSFTDPLSALKNFKEGAAGVYDLLILDIKRPEINGFELYRQIKKIDDEVKICFITAFELYYDKFKEYFPK